MKICFDFILHKKVSYIILNMVFVNFDDMNSANALNVLNHDTNMYPDENISMLNWTSPSVLT